jgi:uridine phosphorylase
LFKNAAPRIQVEGGLSKLNTRPPFNALAMSEIDKRSATKGKVQYHLKMREGDVGEYVLLPGDRGRVKLMSAYLQDWKEVGNNREYLTITGYQDGIKVSVMSTGMGCPASAIAVEELANIGGQVFIRTGSTGALQPSIDVGDLVIATGAVKNEGTSRMYEPVEFPAVASPDVTDSLIEAARSLKHELRFNYHVGIVATDDAFYAETPEFIQNLTRLGVLSMDMESSAIFAVSRLRGLRAGSIMAASENFARKSFLPEQVPAALEEGWKKETQVALKAIELLDSRKQWR